MSDDTRPKHVPQNRKPPQGGSGTALPSEAHGEVRHMARTHHHTLCGAEGLATTSPHHVTCRACLAAYGPVRHDKRYVVSDPDRGPDTLGACAIRELAALRKALAALADLYEADGSATGDAFPAREYTLAKVAGDLRGLLGGDPVIR